MNHCSPVRVPIISILATRPFHMPAVEKRPTGSIRKVVRLVTGPKEITVRGSEGAPPAGSGAEPQKLTHFLES